LRLDICQWKHPVFFCCRHFNDDFDSDIFSCLHYTCDVLGVFHRIQTLFLRRGCLAAIPETDLGIKTENIGGLFTCLPKHVSVLLSQLQRKPIAVRIDQLFSFRQHDYLLLWYRLESVLFYILR
jgi:hypothetical protein